MAGQPNQNKGEERMTGCPKCGKQSSNFPAQMRIMAKLELCNIYGLNVFRFSKDKKARKRAIVLTAAWVVLIAMMVVYVGAMAYGLIQIGLADAVPSYLIMIASVIIFAFGMFKAGSVVFRKNGYDMLCALPLSQTAIVFSRFLRMYVENLAFAVITLLPGLMVYAWFERPGASFYLLGMFTVLAVPLLPLSGAVLVGALVAGISSRMKHKSLASAILTILLVFGIMAASTGLSTMDESAALELLKGLTAAALGLIRAVYPPAVWLGTAMIDGNIGTGILCMILSLAVFAGVTALVSSGFHPICRMLYSTAAKHDYKMQTMKANSVVWALCKREFKRYFASSIYVTNTIIGPLMGMVLAGGLLFLERGFLGDVNLTMLMRLLPVRIDLCAVIAFGLAGIFCMMTTTAVSISLEGENWWIVKSLPLSTKMILDAKILMYLLLLLPFYLVSEVLLILALKPTILNVIWLLVIPAIMILFSGVFGITVNLKLPVLNWENEVTIVKQSAASAIGGLGGFLLAIVCTAALIFVPDEYKEWLKIGICVVVLGLTAIMYRRNNQVDLRKIV